MRRRSVLGLGLWAALWPGSSFAQQQSGQLQAGQRAMRVLWFNAMPDYPPEVVSRHREAMAQYIGSYQGGGLFDVTYTRKLGAGDLASELAVAQYDILILDMANTRARLNASDKAALQAFYSAGRRTLMLDGSFSIRNMDNNPTTRFPGKNGSSAGLLMNQVFALAERGGGVLIGTDHAEWQKNANAALQALVPGARFQGTTKPSTDGDFIGELLLASRVPVTARDILQHWESVPNQGEAPVGTFTDFLGQPITLHALVETADQPGGGRKRPYVSVNFYPGDRRIPIDSVEPAFENLPTHKSGGS